MESNKSQLKKEIIDLCKADRTLAEQLYSELYIYLNYDETLIEVDNPTCEEVRAEKPTWTQNFMHRIRQVLRMKNIEIQFDISEVIDLIEESSGIFGYTFT